MKYIYIILFGALFVSCADEFLDVQPSSSSDKEIESLEDIDKLYNGNFAPYIEDLVNIFSTDNALLPQNVLDESLSFSNEVIQQYTFKTAIDSDSDRSWLARYQEVLLVNLSLELLYEGSLEGDDENLEQLLIAESHYLRALHFFELATIYSLYPSVENEGELGIVLRQTSSYTESLARATVKETFDFIKAEIELALKYPNIEKRSLFRIGKPAVHALAARVYLYLGDYETAEFHADTALEYHSEMVNFDTSVYIYDGTFWYGDFVYPNTAEQISWSGHNSIPDFWIDQYSYMYSQNGSWNTSPSQELLDLYDPADIRNLFFVKDWFERYGVQSDGWYTYMTTYIGLTLSGQGVPEMYLTRAECKARNNDISGAMLDVEQVRINRFHPEDYVALPVPTSISEALSEIIDERRREDPFVYRFMDIKRLNNDPLTDPISITREINGETIVIGPDDRRWARPIGSNAIELSGGETQQNQY